MKPPNRHMHWTAGFRLGFISDAAGPPPVKVRKAAMRVDRWVNWVRETLMALKIRLEYAGPDSAGQSNSVTS